jgi:precorrin-3B C17-methyltransferase
MNGKLWIIGIGPGDRSLLTPLAAAALGQAEVIVGYAGYFEWIADLVESKERIALPLGEEAERARLAVSQVLEGRRVAVISSGDAGIYGMASIVLEILASRQAEVDIEVVPGVSAVNACAALLGAPLGHDFAVISLSDLLTPWERIEKRLDAAAAADFVLAILNPQSRRRDWQLRRAQELLLQHRPPQTSVGVVRNAFRPEQHIRICTIADMAELPIDMFTTLLVGNSQTKVFGSLLVTPRGYPVEVS